MSLLDLPRDVTLIICEYIPNTILPTGEIDMLGPIKSLILTCKQFSFLKACHYLVTTGDDKYDGFVHSVDFRGVFDGPSYATVVVNKLCEYEEYSQGRYVRGATRYSDDDSIVCIDGLDFSRVSEYYNDIAENVAGRKHRLAAQTFLLPINGVISTDLQGKLAPHLTAAVSSSDVRHL